MANYHITTGEYKSLRYNPINSNKVEGIFGKYQVSFFPVREDVNKPNQISSMNFLHPWHMWWDRTGLDTAGNPNEFNAAGTITTVFVDFSEQVEMNFSTPIKEVQIEFFNIYDLYSLSESRSAWLDGNEPTDMITNHRTIRTFAQTYANQRYPLNGNETDALLFPSPSTGYSNFKFVSGEQITTGIREKNTAVSSNLTYATFSIKGTVSFTGKQLYDNISTRYITGNVINRLVNNSFKRRVLRGIEMVVRADQKVINTTTFSVGSTNNAMEIQENSLLSSTSMIGGKHLSEYMGEKIIGSEKNGKQTIQFTYIGPRWLLVGDTFTMDDAYGNLGGKKFIIVDIRYDGSIITQKHIYAREFA